MPGYQRLTIGREAFARRRRTTRRSSRPSASATRDLHAGRRLDPAACGHVLVDLERAQLRIAACSPRRPGPTTASRTRPRMYRNLVDAGVDRAPATGHGHDTVDHRRARAARLPAQPQYGGHVAGRRSCARCTASTRTTARCAGTAAREPRLSDDRRRRSRRFRAQNPALFGAERLLRPPVYALVSAELGAVPTCEHRPVHRRWRTIGNLTRRSTGPASAYGSHTQFPIYSTEFGYMTSPPKPRQPEGQGLRRPSRRRPRTTSTGPSTSPARTRGSRPSSSTCCTTRPADGGERLGRLRERAADLERSARSPATAPGGCRCTCRRRPRSRGHSLEVWGGVRAGAVRVARHRRRPADRRHPVRSRTGRSTFTTVQTVTITNREGLLRHPRHVPRQRHGAAHLHLPDRRTCCSYRLRRQPVYQPARAESRSRVRHRRYCARWSPAPT